MAEGVALTTVAFQTRDTTRMRKREQLVKRSEIIRKRMLDQSIANQPITASSGETQPDPHLVSLSTSLIGTSPEETSQKMSQTNLRTCCSKDPVSWANKNLYATSVSFMFVFSAFVGIQNIQSSLNAQIGTLSLALTYAFYFIIGFMTPAIIRLLGTKYSLLFGYICHTVYIATNFYPEYFTLVPSSVLLGIGSGPVWAGLSTHLATTAITLVPYVMESIDDLIARFTGTFFFIFQLTQILGNIVSSLALYPYNDGIIEVVGEVCNNTEASDISEAQTYSLLSVYILFDIIGILILLIFVDRHTRDSDMMEMKSKVRQFCTEPFVDLWKILVSWKMLLLGPLSLYNGMELSFAYSSFTQNVISNCVGVSQVGFALIVLGFFSATLSVVYGKLVKFVPRWVFGTCALIINLFFLLFLQFYPLRPSFALIYLFAIFWGIADGIWNTLSASLVGILFPNHQEAAYSAFRIWMSLGFTFGFAITEILEFRERLWTMFAVLVASYILYTLLELFYSKFGQKYICLCKLGIFSGPQNHQEEDSTFDSMLTEAMLDAQLGMSGDSATMTKMYERAYFNTSGYNPPPKRSVTYSSTYLKKNRESSRKKLQHIQDVLIENDSQGEEVVEFRQEQTEKSFVQTAQF